MTLGKTSQHEIIWTNTALFALSLHKSTRDPMGLYEQILKYFESKIALFYLQNLELSWKMPAKHSRARKQVSVSDNTKSLTEKCISENIWKICFACLNWVPR